MYKYIKRVVDIVFSIIFIVLTFIPMLIIAFLIWKDDGGSPFFIQDRMGKDLIPFKMIKFRSMKENRKELDGKMTHEQMVTKFGAFLRKTSLDELPQLFNVFIGKMSFIGPRPWMLQYYDSMTPIQKRRANVKPGITGLAQVRGRNGIPIQKKIEYDLEYVNHFGWKYDVKILIETIKVVLSKDNAEITESGITQELRDLRENPKGKKRKVRS